jgi:nucleoid-associated protein YgaU
MRKDAKIGFAIGGVLLAVLTVYVLIVPSHKNPTHNTVTLATGPGSTAVPSDSVSIPPTPPVDTTPALAPAPSKAAEADKPTDSKPAAARNNNSDGVNWEKILGGGSSDAPTLTSTTPLPGDTSAAVIPAAAVTSVTPTPLASSDMALSAVTPTAPVMAARTVDVAPSTQPSGARMYIIKPGQTLSKIAAEIYGNSRFYVAIKRANPTIDPNNLKPGMRITLPDISDVKPDAAHDSARLVKDTRPVNSTGKTYTVQSGDTLYRISKNLYGSPKQADTIYELNKSLIGPDKARLKLGMVLQLPAAPAQVIAASTR